MQPEKIVGLRFGRLQVLRHAGIGGGGRIYECRCDCGTLKTIRGGSLRRGLTISCGCAAKDANKARHENSRKEILNRVAKREDGCWIWQGRVDKKGYGRLAGKLVHRVFYQTFVGEIPQGCHIDHTCWEPACCNPSHLRPLSAIENMKRQRSALKEHCVHGHLLSRQKNGRRSCLTCNLVAVRRYKARVRAA